MIYDDGVKLSRINSCLSRYEACICPFLALKCPDEYRMPRCHKKHNNIAHLIGLLLLIYSTHEVFATLPAVLYLNTILDLPALLKVVYVSPELVSHRV